jgi:hypothetical protein
MSFSLSRNGGLCSEEEMSVEDAEISEQADRLELIPVVDVRRVPLARLCGDAAARELVHKVLIDAKGASLLVVSAFGSAI